MLLLAYFRNVGAVLLALLLIADFYLATPPVTERAATHSPVIQVHSQRKLPEPVIFDTTQIVLAAVAPAQWDRNPSAPPAAREMPIDRVDTSGVRASFALAPRAESYRATSAERKKRYSARAPRRNARHQIILAARQGQFGWFGFRY